MAETNQHLVTYRDAVQRIKGAILQSRYRAAANANVEMLSLYYNVGRYISANSRTGKWGTGAIESISAQLQGEIPGLHGFSPTNMKNMRVFYEEWSPVFDTNRQTVTADLQDEDDSLLIRQTLSAELDDLIYIAFCKVGFSHHREILRKCKTYDERWYYIVRCADEFWSYRTLKHHLGADDYNAYGRLPNNFILTMPDEKTAKKAVLSFRDDYLLDFIEIKDPDDYDERDVVNAIAADVKKFIMTMGEGFSFIGHQYRLLVDDEEFFVDMLFFERNLQSLVAFELKRDKFRPADLGQLSFYLSALDKYVKKPNENKSIGILLCQEMNRTVVELAVQDYDKPLGVATYRLGTGIPEQYSSLIPVINGVEQIITANSKNDSKDGEDD